MVRIRTTIVTVLVLFTVFGYSQSEHYSGSGQLSYLKTPSDDGTALQVFDRQGSVVFKELIQKSSKLLNTCSDIVCYEDGAVKRIVIYTNSNTSGDHTEKRFFFDRSGYCYDSQQLKNGIPVQLLGAFRF